VQHGQDKGKSAHKRGELKAGRSEVEQMGAMRYPMKEGRKEMLGATGRKKGARKEPSSGKL